MLTSYRFHMAIYSNKVPTRNIIKNKIRLSNILSSNKAIKYCNKNQSQIWNNLCILTATKCWRKCSTIDSSHCEALRNLDNMQRLHYYDNNKCLEWNVVVPNVNLI